MSHPNPPKVTLEKYRMKVGVSTTGPQQTWYDLINDSLLVSQSNRRLKGAWEGGGNFYCTKVRYNHGPIGPVVSWYRNGVLAYGVTRGCMSTPSCGFPPGWIVIPTNGNMPAVSNPSWSQKYNDLMAVYATGYKRARPGNPQASLGQFIVELRDLPKIPGRELWKLARRQPLSELPKIFLKNLAIYRSLGSEYLNLEFGWRPFVSDLRKMYNLWWSIDKEMARLIRENGRGVHRRVKLEEESSTNSTSTSSPLAYAWTTAKPADWFTRCGSWGQWTIVTRKRQWFAGKFTYWIPDVSSSMWNARARLALFGALPTPELLWEVIPWSWLVDWFGNVGDVISNISTNAVDNLVCKYAYVMESTEISQMAHMHTWHEAQVKSPSNQKEWNSCDHSFWSEMKVSTKARAGGSNPFGLGVQLTSLTARQLAILAALGISRGLVR